MYVVCWHINGKYGTGKPQVSLEVALSWVRHGNTKYGAGTHWVFRQEFDA